MTKRYSYRRHKKRVERQLARTNQRLKRHPFIMPIVIFLIFIAISAVLFLNLTGRTVGPQDANIVILHVDREVKELPTREQNVASFLNKAGVTLNPGDVVEPGLDALIEEDNFRINVYRAAPVVVIDGKSKKFGLSAALTARSMAEQIGVKLYAEDHVVTEPSDDFLRDGSIGNKLVVDRATPMILNLYGTPLKIRSHAKTVSELLTEKKVRLKRGDNIHPKADVKLGRNAQVFVTRAGTKIVIKEEAIAPPIETVEDASLSFGATAVRQRGRPGLRTVTYQIKLRKGVEVSRKLIQEVVVEEPVAQVVARGRAVAISGDKRSWMAGAGVKDSDYPYVNYIISRESGWCPTKWQGQVGYCPAYYTDLHPANSGYGFGLCQSTPAGKMASAGADWQTNPVTQMKWCHGYAIGRYGSWAAAYNHWITYHWW